MPGAPGSGTWAVRGLSAQWRKDGSAVHDSSEEDEGILVPAECFRIRSLPDVGFSELV